MLDKESLFEKSLYFLVSLIINLILFSYLSFYLLIKGLDIQVSEPIRLLLEEVPKVEEVTFEKTVLNKAHSQKGLKPQNIASNQIPLEAKKGDTPISSTKEENQREESILSEIERKVISKKADTDKGGVKVGENLGEIKADIAQGEVGFSGGSRQVVYVPTFPKIAVAELPSATQIRIWVEPSGKISRVEVIKRSGVPEVDKAIVDFVKGIRFEPIRDNIIQTGIITFKFKGG
ncbi:energy transducer TonB family protein [Thermocrinis sp.]